MGTSIRIDFVSDVSCPWCVVGLKSLERALDRLGERVQADLHFQPFELNPGMGPEGQDLDEHLAQKYGGPPERFAATRAALTQRGAELGFEFRLDRRNRIYNTFDAHRLLHWAEGEGGQRALKHALFKAYFTDGEDPSSAEVLIRTAAAVGLDAERARAILDSDQYADAVRERERYYTGSGIHAVPAVIINERYLVEGGQPAEVFEQVLERVATEADAPAIDQ